MNRRKFIRGAAVSAGAAVVASLPGAADPVITIAEEWLMRDSLSLNHMTEEEIDAFHDWSGKLMDRLLQTPAATIDGMKAKLAVLYRWHGFDDATGEPPTDYGGQMVCSLLADAASLVAS